MSESACPFCDVATSAEFRARKAPIAPPKKLSRAALFAFTAAASATSVACGSETTVTPVYGAPVMDTGTDAGSDTAIPSDAGVDTAGDAEVGSVLPLYGGPFDTGSPPDGSGD